MCLHFCPFMRLIYREVEKLIYGIFLDTDLRRWTRILMNYVFFKLFCGYFKKDLIKDKNNIK